MRNKSILYHNGKKLVWNSRPVQSFNVMSSKNSSSKAKVASSNKCINKNNI